MAEILVSVAVLKNGVGSFDFTTNDSNYRMFRSDDKKLHITKAHEFATEKNYDDEIKVSFFVVSSHIDFDAVWLVRNLQPTKNLFIEPLNSSKVKIGGNNYLYSLSPEAVSN